MQRLIFLSLMAVLAAVNAPGQSLVFESSLETETLGLNVTSLSPCGDHVLFIGTTPGTGAEPWISDGTPEGTFQLANLHPTDPSTPVIHAAEMNDSYYFLHGDAYYGYGSSPMLEGVAGLYRTDGTPEGTSRIAECHPLQHPKSMLVVDSTLYFIAFDGTAATWLWVSDGTPAGTRQLTMPDGHLIGGSLHRSGDSVMFYSHNFVTGTRLWISDGTDVGTRTVKDFAPGPGSSVYYYQLVSFDGNLWFAANDGTGHTIWKTDGTEHGTVPAGIEHPEPVFQVAATPGTLFLRGDNSLWGTDGTPGAATHLADLDIEGTPVVFGDYLIFSVRLPDYSTELWRSDGTPAGTVPISGDAPALTWAESTVPVLAGSSLYFISAEGGQLTKLVTTNGVPTGTERLNTQASTITNLPHPALAPLGDSLLFRGGPPTATSLWKSGSTLDSAVELVPRQEYGRGLGPSVQQERSTNHVSMASTGGSNPRLNMIVPHEGDVRIWRSDGTLSGTILRHIVPDGNRGGPIYQFKNAELFTLMSGQDPEFWTIQKGDRPTRLRELMQPAFAGRGRILGAASGFAFLEVFYSTYYTELWRSDGTPGGTKRILALPAAPNTRIDRGFVADNILYFATSTNQLWRSDGTEQGTYQLAVGLRLSDPHHLGVESDPLDSEPRSWAVLGNEVFFVCDNLTETREVWCSDGTVHGTRLVHSLPMHAHESFTIGVVRDRLIFTSYAPESGHELWVSDGTPGSLRLLADLAPGAAGSYPANLTTVGGWAFFTARTPEFGREVWVTDGTTDGTRIVKDIAPGASSSMPSAMVAAGGVLYFTAWDPVHGAELWRSDGTSGGTQLVADIQPGAGDSKPVRTTRVGNRLYFLAVTDDHGLELYVLKTGGGGGGGGEGCTAGTHPPGNAALLLLLVATLATMRAGLVRRAGPCMRDNL